MLYISLLIFVCSCANVPDEPICAEVSMSEGRCSYMVSNKQIKVNDDNLLNGKTWFDIRRQALTMPAESWAKIKAWIIKMCKKYRCDAEIDSWDRTLETIDSAVNR